MSEFTFAEHGEDILIHRLLLWKDGGFYIDCGAYHARNMSLTARLRNFGWTGINIEIDPQAAYQLNIDLPGTLTICAAIGESNGTATFYKYADPVLNTIDPIQHAHLQRLQSSGELFTNYLGSKEIQTRTIDQILNESSIPKNKVDFLNLDIEGVELIALKGFPWATQCPAVIACEIHRLDLSSCNNHPIVAYMVDLGYVLQSYVFHTAIFVRKDFDTELCHRHQTKKL